MSIFSRELLENAMEPLRQDEDFIHISRALTATITFEANAENAAYLEFYRGRLMNVDEGYSVYGSEFYICATDENWKKAFTQTNPRYGIFELDGDLIRLKGNQYVFAANAKAFYRIWLAVRRAYNEEHRTESGQ